MGGWESPSHWLVIAILVIALFGYKKLPDAARSVGRSLRIFKTEVKGMSEDDKARDAAKEAERDQRSDSAGAAAVAPPVAVPPVAVPPVAVAPAPPAVQQPAAPPVMPLPPTPDVDSVRATNSRSVSGE